MPLQPSAAGLDRLVVALASRLAPHSRPRRKAKNNAAQLDQRNSSDRPLERMRERSWLCRSGDSTIVIAYVSTGAAPFGTPALPTERLMAPLTGIIASACDADTVTATLMHKPYGMSGV